MSLPNEQILDISLPRNHELTERVNNTPEDSQSAFRTRAAVLLGSEFSGHFSTLCETGSSNTFSLRVQISAERADEFRQRVAKLGFTVAEANSDRRWIE